MEHLNKICALTHIQEIIDIIKTPIKKVNDESVMEEIVKDEIMHECADLALVTNQQHEGQCGFVLEDLEYELTRIAAKITDARQEYLIGDDKVPMWLAKIERDSTIENYLKMAGIVADCFAKARAVKIGIKYTTLLNERAEKFKSINLDYNATSEICPTYDDPYPFDLPRKECPHADKDSNGIIIR